MVLCPARPHDGLQPGPDLDDLRSRSRPLQSTPPGLPHREARTPALAGLLQFRRGHVALPDSEVPGRTVHWCRPLPETPAAGLLSALAHLPPEAPRIGYPW